MVLKMVQVKGMVTIKELPVFRSWPLIIVEVSYLILPFLYPSVSFSCRFLWTRHSALCGAIRLVLGISIVTS